MRSPIAYAPRPGPLGDAGALAASAYLGSLALVAFIYSNPVVLAGAGAAVLAAGLLARAGRALAAAARWGATLGVLIVAVNAIASQRGDTILIRGGDLPVLGQVDVSGEALVEGGGARAADHGRSRCLCRPLGLRRSRPAAAAAAPPGAPFGADRDPDHPARAARGRRPRPASRRPGPAWPRSGNRRPRRPHAQAGRRIARPRRRRRRGARAARLRARGAAAGRQAAKLAPRVALRRGRGADRRARRDRPAGRGGGLRGLSDGGDRPRPGDGRASPPRCRCSPPRPTSASTAAAACDERRTASAGADGELLLRLSRRVHRRPRGGRPGARRGRVRDPRRALGERQVEPASRLLRARAPLPRRRGRGDARGLRTRRARQRPGRARRPRRARRPGPRDAGGLGDRPRRARAAARAARRAGGRRGRGRSRRSPWRWRSSIWWTGPPTRSRAASCSGSRSPPRWSCARGWCCSTSRRRSSIRSPATS